MLPPNVSAQAWSPCPAVIALNHLQPLPRIGTLLHAMNAAPPQRDVTAGETPSCPTRLEPQQKAAPVSASAHVCIPPEDMTRNRTSPLTASGMVLPEVLPSPRLPAGLASQQYARSSSAMPHVVLVPTARVLNNGAGMRNGWLCGRVTSTPFCRATHIAPQQNVRPSAVRAHVRRSPAASDENTWVA